jgi:phosphate transport system substrate-binding protein
MRRHIFTVFTGLIALSMLLAACAPAAAPTAIVEPTQAAAEPTAAPADPTATTAVEPTATTAAMPAGVDPATLTGDIYAAGSSTVGPLSEAVAEQFIADGFTGQIKNDIIGSGAGFERFCKTGETDIANASRPIKDTEIANCAALNPVRTPIGFKVGLDAIAIVVNKDNTFLTNVTMEQLGKIFTSAEKWSDVDPSWPAEPILRYTPGTDSGTYDFFAEFAIQKPNKLKTLDEAKKLVLNAKNLNQSEDDNVLVQGVEGNKYAIGYFGFAYYKAQSDRLNVLSINGITPSEKTAEDGSYALSRPLFLYSDAAILKAKPQVAGFIRYYLENVNSLIHKVGYFPASADTLAKSLADLDAALK